MLYHLLDGTCFFKFCFNSCRFCGGKIKSSQSQDLFDGLSSGSALYNKEILFGLSVYLNGLLKYLHINIAINVFTMFL